MKEFLKRNAILTLIGICLGAVIGMLFIRTILLKQEITAHKVRYDSDYKHLNDQLAKIRRYMLDFKVLGDRIMERSENSGHIDRRK